MKTTHLEEKRTALIDRREKLIARFEQAAREPQRHGARCMREIHKDQRILGEPGTDRGRDRSQARSRIPALCGQLAFPARELQKTHRRPGRAVLFRYRLGDRRVCWCWTNGRSLPTKTRTMMGVTGDTRSTHNLLIKLEQFKHRLLAHFHSHPGNGADATRPSGTDEHFQKRLESAGHVAVMAIFSRDGFVRFVRLDQNLEIEIYGEGAEKHAPGIYRLTNLD